MEILEKLIKIERQVSLEKGDFDLFALFLREDSFEKWDVLVSAMWISADKGEALKYLASKVQNSLNQEELLRISGIIIIEESNPALPALQQAISIEHSSAEIKNSNFFGLQIKHAYLITSKKRSVTKEI